MGITVPTTDVEVRDVCVGVLAQLRDILEVCGFATDTFNLQGIEQTQYYLLVLRRPPLSDIFKSSYTKANLPPEGALSLTTKTTDVGIDQPQNPAFPMVQPMKASLYFEDIEGFGEWVILLSTRAQKYLRDIKGADGAMFWIVIKKIKWVPVVHRNYRC